MGLEKIITNNVKARHFTTDVAGNIIVKARHKKPSTDEKRLAARRKEWNEEKNKEGTKRPGSLNGGK